MQISPRGRKMRLVGLSPADYSIDRLATVLIKSISPHLFSFFCDKKKKMQR